MGQTGDPQVCELVGTEMYCLGPYGAYHSLTALSVSYNIKFDICLVKLNISLLFYF